MKNRARAGVVAVALLAAAGGCSSKSGGTGGTGGSAGAAPYDTNEQACDPLTPSAITLGTVVGVGKDSGGTLYVDASSGVFVSGSGELVRQHVVGTGQSGSNEFLFSFVAPGADYSTAQNLLVETQSGKADKMALGPADSKEFLNQSPQGITMLTLVDPSSVAGMKLVNAPDVIVYVADVSNGNVILTTEPMNDSDWNPATGGLSIFYGPPNAVAQRKITDFQQSMSNSGTLTFLVGSTPYVLSFGTVPAPDAGPLGKFELQSLTPKGGAPLDVTLRSPTPTKLPAGLSFTCFAGG